MKTKHELVVAAERIDPIALSASIAQTEVPARPKKRTSKQKKKGDPKLRRQSGPHGDRAFVELPDAAGGRTMRVYLGTYGTPESKTAYHKTLGEWEANERRTLVTGPGESSDLTIVELCDQFVEHAARTYLKDGKETSTVGNYRRAAQFLARLYGPTDAESFSPMALKTVRNAMIKADWNRKTVNQSINLIRFIFRWGAEEEKVSADVHTAICKVAGLRKGRSKARESKRVPPVADSVVAGTLPFLSTTVRAMVQLEELTGMRPHEVCDMRTCDLNTSGTIWEYRPRTHKTENHDHDRIVMIGPRGQAILRPLLKKKLDAFIFSPLDSAAENIKRRHEARQTPASYGNSIGSNRVRKPQRRPGAKFTTASYRRAIERACARAWPIPDEIKDKPEEVNKWIADHRWAPNRLRHNHGTRVRRDFGLEAAQVVLGHSAANITEIYAERDQTLAAAVALKIG